MARGYPSLFLPCSSSLFASCTWRTHLSLGGYMKFVCCLLKVKPTLTEEQRTAIAGELEETIVGCGRLWTAVPWGVVVFR